MPIIKFLLDIPAICSQDYWNGVLQNAIGCAIGSIIGVGIALWIYYRQSSDNEKEKQKAELKNQENTLTFFSVSIKEITFLIDHQLTNIEKYINESKLNPLDFQMMTYVPLFPIKRIIESTSLDKILIPYTNKFAENKNAINEFSEIISILDYLYLELASIPETLERAQRFDHERQQRFSNYYKIVWDNIGSLIAHDQTGIDPIILGFKKILTEFINQEIDTGDIKYYHDNIIVPVNNYSIKLLGQGNLNPVFEELALVTRDSKQLYNDIIKHNKNFIINDIQPIFESLSSNAKKLKEHTKSLVS